MKEFEGNEEKLGFYHQDLELNKSKSETNDL